MENVKMLLIDVEQGNYMSVFADGLDDYHKLCNCDYIDIVARRVGKNGKFYNFIVDDEGLLKSNPIISAMGSDGLILAGNTLIAGGVDSEGELTGLTDEDIKYLSSYIHELIDFRTGTIHPVLTQLNY